MNAGTSPAGSEPVTPSAAPTESIAGSARSARLRETMRNILSQRSAQVGLIILTILIASAILAPVIAPYDPEDPLNGPGEPGRRADPCIHLLGCPEDQMQTYLGTDGNSRDIFSRVIWGGRLSIPLGPVVVGFGRRVRHLRVDHCCDDADDGEHDDESGDPPKASPRGSSRDGGGLDSVESGLDRRQG